MKKRQNISALFITIMFGVLLLLAVTIYDVSAQATDTPTPQPTATLWTPTPFDYEFPDDFDCPEGDPVGLGTVTPNAIWDFACGACLTKIPTNTPQPIATGTPNEQGTPAPTFTPTAAPTSTPVTTAPPLHVLSWGSYDVHQATASMDCSEYNGGIICNFSIVASSRWQGDNARATIGVSFEPTGEFSNYYIVVDALSTGTHTYDGAGYNSNGIYYQSCANPYCWNSYSSQYVWPSLPQEAQQVAYIEKYYQPFPESFSVHGSNGFGSTSTFSGVIYIFPFPVDPDTIYDPVTVSYCESIDGETALGEFDPDPAFGWSGVAYGDASCLVLGGQEFSVLGLSVSVPEVTICFQELYLGSLLLFGMAVNLDIVAVVGVGVWLLRRFISS